MFFISYFARRAGATARSLREKNARKHERKTVRKAFHIQPKAFVYESGVESDTIACIDKFAYVYIDLDFVTCITAAFSSMSIQKHRRKSYPKYSENLEK
jgi:hypothetical protein